MTTATMRDTLQTLRGLWADLQNQYPELRGWTFKINRRATRRLGCCKYRKKVVEVTDFLLADCEKAMDTLLHEAAHALAGPHAKHGPAWKRWARTLGADPTRTGHSAAASEMREVMRKPPKYTGTCDTCAETFTKRRMKRQHRDVAWCCPCGGSITFGLNPERYS